MPSAMIRRWANNFIIPWAVASTCTWALPPAAGAGAPRHDMAQNAATHSSGPSGTGQGEPTGPAEPETHLKLPLPTLNLSDSQRQMIRQAVTDKDTEVTFQIKTTKPLQTFNPTVGTKIPPHLPAHALPTTLTSKLPALTDYKYVKIKGQILIVNPMTKKIVDMFPEAPG